MGFGKGKPKCIVRGCKDTTSRRIRLPHPLSDMHQRYPKWLDLADAHTLKEKDPMYVYTTKRICERHFSAECFVVGTTKLKKNALPNRELPEAAMEDQEPQPGPSGLAVHIPCETIASEAAMEDQEPQPGPSGLAIHIPCETIASESDTECQESPQLWLSNQKLPGTTASPSRPTTPEVITSTEAETPRAPVKRRALARGQGMEGVLRHVGVRKAVELTPKAKHLYETAKRLRRSVQHSSKKLVNFKKRLQAAEKTLNICPGSFEGLPRIVSMFLQCQIREASRKGKGHRFPLDYKVWALSLLKRSGRAYDFLSKWFVLPSRRTLLRLLSGLSFTTGINNDMFDYLSVTVRKKVTEIDRHCILMFDEMALTPQLTFLEHLDFIEGFKDLGGGNRAPRFADKALVFMVRGLRRCYKQPVAYVFPSGTIKTHELSKLLKAVIKKLTLAGLSVCATVCDQGSTNVAAIACLCAETRESVLRSGGEYRGDYFSVGDIKVIPLFDPPHLLKGMRNGLLSKDLKFNLRGENKTASWQHILQFYAIDNREFRAVPSLTDLHVVPEKIRKMKVSYCCQVFSQRLSSVMGLLASKRVDGLDPTAVDTADLLNFFDQLFDSVNGNSRQPSPNKPLRCAVTSSSGHMEFWANSIKVLESMAFTDGYKDSKTPSIKNWVRTLRNMRALWLKLRSNGFKSLSPRNLNQDPLENKFGSIRSYGFRNVNPTCTNFVGAYKGLILNDMVAPHSVGASCEEDDCEVLDNLRNYLTISRQSAHTSSSLPGVTSDVLEDDDNPTPDEDSCPSELGSTISISSWSAAEMLRKLQPVNCPDCSGKQSSPPHNTPSADFIDTYKEAIVLILNHLPTSAHMLGVGAHLRNILTTSLNMSQIACDDHISTYGSRFCSIVVRNVVTYWCNSVNRYLRGKHTAHSEDMDTIHRLARKYYTKKKRVR